MLLVLEKVFVSSQDFPFPVSELFGSVLVSRCGHHLEVEIISGAVQDRVSVVPHVPQYFTELFVEDHCPAAACLAELHCLVSVFLNLFQEAVLPSQQCIEPPYLPLSSDCSHSVGRPRCPPSIFCLVAIDGGCGL